MPTEVEVKAALDQAWREHGDEIKAGAATILRVISRLTHNAITRLEGDRDQQHDPGGSSTPLHREQGQ